MIFLPYADDVRNLKFEPTPIATDELIVDAKKIVEKLTVKSLSVDSRAHFTSHNRGGQRRTGRLHSKSDAWKRLLNFRAAVAALRFCLISVR